MQEGSELLMDSEFVLALAVYEEKRRKWNLSLSTLKGFKVTE